MREGFLPGLSMYGSMQHPIVSNVGDVMYDAALFYKDIAQPTEATSALMERLFNGFYLATIHRAENTDDSDRLKSIFTSLLQISKDTQIVLPLHPRTQKKLESIGLLKLPNRHELLVIEPVGYFDMITLLTKCRGVFTDSGGVQKEAYYFNKPCVTLRDETEWVELVEHGFNTLVGADREKILAAAREIGTKRLDYSMALYGNGDAAKKIVQMLAEGVL